MVYDSFRRDDLKSDLYILQSQGPTLMAKRTLGKIIYAHRPVFQNTSHTSLKEGG